MRCLLLTPFVPYPPVDGGRVRILGLLDALAARCDVDVLSLAREEGDLEALAGLRKQGHAVEAVFEEKPSPVAIARAVGRGASLYLAKYGSRAFPTALAARLKSTPYDVVQCEYPYTGQFRFAAPRTNASWVLDAHNVEHSVSRRLEQLSEPGNGPGNGPVYRLYSRRETAARRREEVSICRSMDAVVTVSEVDGSALAEAAPGLETITVPNGVDLARLTPNMECESTLPTGLFVGKLDYRPNVDGLRWFTHSILPRILDKIPEFELIVAGSGDPRKLTSVFQSPAIRFVGLVADVVPYLHEAWVIVAPLRAGSGQGSRS